MPVKVKSLFKNKHKYSTVFTSNSNVKIYAPSQEDRHLAKASIEKLRPFLPKDVNLDENYDLIGMTTVAAAANRVNMNHQYVDGAILRKVAPLFHFKQVNWEHGSDIVGCLTSHSWTEFGTDERLSDERLDELIAKQEPFNLVLSGYIWRKALGDDQYEKIEESNDPASSLYGQLSSSWEIFFKNFNIGIKNKDNEISFITDDNEIYAKQSTLKHFQGSGFDSDGNLYFLNLLPQDLLPSGLGLTFEPASSIKGLLIANSNADLEPLPTNDEVIESNEYQVDATTSIDENLELVASTDEPINSCSCGDSESSCECNINDDEQTPNGVIPNTETSSNQVVVDEENNKNENNLEKSEIVGVITEHLDNSSQESNTKKTIMKLKSLDEVTDEALTKGEVTASVLTDYFSVKLKEANDKYLTEKVEVDNALATAESEKVTLTSELEQVKVAAQTVQAELDQVKADASAREKAETFNTRVLAISNDFELDEAQKEVIAEEIKDLDVEAFDKYLNKISVFAKKKMPFEKTVDKKDDDEKDPDEEDPDEEDAKKKAKAEYKAKEVMASLEVDADQIVPPNAVAPIESLQEKWSHAFTNVEIK